MHDPKMLENFKPDYSKIKKLNKKFRVFHPNDISFFFLYNSMIHCTFKDEDLKEFEKIEGSI